MSGREPVDVVLSGGFLAFAEQAGFLQGVEDCGLEVGAVCGTSSGALAGALWLAGMPAREVLRRLTERAPLWRMRPSLRPWRGLLSMRPVIRELRRDLPARFSDLPVPFAVGVLDEGRRARLLWSGPLPRAVAASCAIPRLFGPVRIGGALWADGGVVERTGLGRWRRARPGRPLLVHWVESGRGIEPEEVDGFLVRSPAAGVSLWNLGDVQARFERARERTAAVLRSGSSGVVGGAIARVDFP